MADWNNGLLGCFGNTSLCIISNLSPYFVFGKTAEKMGENPVLWVLGLCAAPCCVGAYMRGMIRRKLGIPGSFNNDCMIYLCAQNCAIQQEAAQLMSMDPYLDQPETQIMERTPVQ